MKLGGRWWATILLKSFFSAAVVFAFGLVAAFSTFELDPCFLDFDCVTSGWRSDLAVWLFYIGGFLMWLGAPIALIGVPIWKFARQRRSRPEPTGVPDVYSSPHA